MPLPREIFRVNADVPVVVTLDRDLSGQEARGKFGTQFALTVNGGTGTLYLDTQHREVLQRCGAQPGDAVEFLKTYHNRMPMYTARVVAPPQNGHTNGHGSKAVTACRDTANGYSNGPERVAQAGAAAHQPQQPPQAGSSHLAKCLCAAIDAAIEAQEYARAKNFSVTFLGGDIRAMANSVYINDQQNGGAR